MTPVILQQFRMYYQDAPPEQGGKRPIGVILWGSVNQEIEKALAQGITHMRPGDWKSGDRIWVVEIIAPFGGAEAMVSDFKTKVFADRPVRFLTVKDGKKDVKVV